jgi:hypothetical protein
MKKGALVNLKKLKNASALVLLLGLGLLVGCDHGIDQKLAEQAAVERSLNVMPAEFAIKFNQALVEVLGSGSDPDAARMAPLFAIDVARLTGSGQVHVLDTHVGPARTGVLGSLAKNGQLKNVGILLTDRSQGAREEFFLCVESASHVFVPHSGQPLLPQLTRLVGTAINVPGQRITAIIDSQLFSAELTPQGLLFQIEAQSQQS